MKAIAILIVVSVLFTPTLSLTRCGLCVGRGDVCVAGRGINCGDNLKCSPTEQGGTATICLPTFEEGKQCTSVGVDTCEGGYACNRTGSGNCDYIEGSIRKLGDYCADSSWCGPGLTCNGGKCQLSGQCTTALYGCPIHQYCNIDICTDKAGEGQDCSAIKPCHPTLYCDLVSTEPKCKTYYSTAENENCTSYSQCKSGLVCSCSGALCQPKCIKPVYFFLPAYGGVAWGDICDPADPSTGSGCRCNYATKTYLYLKEYSTLGNDGCNPIAKEFYKCLADKGCSNSDVYARSCMRENCYGQYVNFQTICSANLDPSLLPPRCSAQGIAALFSLLLLFLLL